VDEPFLPTIGMRHVVDQLVLVDLTKSVSRHRPLAANHAPAIGHGELRLVPNLLAGRRSNDRVERWIEHVEDQATPVNQVSPYADQARQLLVDRQQVLKRSKRDGGQCELPAQVEIAHIRVHQHGSLLNRVIFLLQAPAAHVEHLWRQIEPGDRNASPGRRNEHTTGATANLENRTSRLRSGVDEEQHIRASPIWHDMVIEAHNRLIRVITAISAGTCQCALRSISQVNVMS
jgi:hypothetical protein